MAKQAAPQNDIIFEFEFDPKARPLDWARCAEAYLDMITHTRAHDGGIRKLLELQRPGESKEAREFALNNWEAISKAAITNAKSDIFGAISSAEYAIYHESEIVQDYLFNKKFSDQLTPGSGFNYDKWLINIAAKERMTDDPNGFMTWLPVEIPDTMQERAQFEPYLIYRIFVTHFDRDRITFYRPENKFYLQNGVLGKEFWTITKTAFWKHTQVYNSNKNKSEEVYKHQLVYEHNTGTLLINVLGGISDVAIDSMDWQTRATFSNESRWNPNLLNWDNTTWSGVNSQFPITINYYESFLSGYIPCANESIKAFSDWQKSRVKTAHPVTVRQGTPCPNPECNGGYIEGDESSNFRKQACPTCKGGTLTTNPLGDIVIPPNTNAGLEGSVENIPDPFRYVIPPTDSLKAMEESFWRLMEKAEEQIYQKFNEAAQSDVAKRRDREGKYNFISSISDHIFLNLAYNHLWNLILLVEINNPEPCKIVAPVEFELKTESELLEDLKELKNSGAPQAVIRQAEARLMKRTFIGDEYATDVIRVMGIFDELYGMTSADIEAYRAMGDVTGEMVQKHILAYQVVSNIIMKEGEDWLAETNPDKVREKMNVEFELLKPKPTSPPVIVPPNVG